MKHCTDVDGLVGPDPYKGLLAKSLAQCPFSLQYTHWSLARNSLVARYYLIRLSSFLASILSCLISLQLSSLLFLLFLFFLWSPICSPLVPTLFTRLYLQRPFSKCSISSVCPFTVLLQHSFVFLCYSVIKHSQLPALLPLTTCPASLLTFIVFQLHQKSRND